MFLDWVNIRLFKKGAYNQSQDFDSEINKLKPSRDLYEALGYSGYRVEPQVFFGVLRASTSITKTFLSRFKFHQIKYFKAL